MSVTINPQSTDWLAVRSAAAARQARLRGDLEGDLGPEKTAAIRGQLVCLKWLLSLPERQLEDTQMANHEPASY